MRWLRGGTDGCCRASQREEAARRTRIVDLHPQRQMQAIIGVVYCPLSPSIQQAYDEFLKLCKWVGRCL